VGVIARVTPVLNPEFTDKGFTGLRETFFSDFFRDFGDFLAAMF
jgi:hypothetical protein